MPMNWHTEDVRWLYEKSTKSDLKFLYHHANNPCEYAEIILRAQERGIDRDLKEQMLEEMDEYLDYWSAFRGYLDACKNK
jgi:hypothetical protein